MKDNLKKIAKKNFFKHNKFLAYSYYLWIIKIKYVKIENKFRGTAYYDIRYKLNPFNPLTYIFHFIAILIAIGQFLCTDILDETIKLFKYN